MKKVVTCILVIILLFSVTPINSKAEVPNEFAGIRRTSWLISQSDISNYIGGGRYALELLSRSFGADWLDCTFRSVGRNMEISMAYSFSSMQDYLDKTAALIGYQPSVLYEKKGKQIAYMESFHADEAFHWLEILMIDQAMLSEFQPLDLFSLTSCTLMLNDVTYETMDRILVQPEVVQAVVSGLDIQTTADLSGAYNRTITMRIPISEMKRAAGRALEKAMSDVDDEKGLEKREEGEMQILTANLVAIGLQDLAEQTSIALGTPVSICEFDMPQDEKTTIIRFMEEMMLVPVLAQGGTFTYSYTLPATVSDVRLDLVDIANSNAYQLSGKQLQYSGSANESTVRFAYDCGVRFENVTVMTDFSHDLGKIKRTITYSLRSKQAEPLHQSLKEAIADQLVRGASLKIYDNDGIRYYEVTYQSYLMKQINQFTGEFFSKNDFKFSRSWGLFSTGNLSETLENEELLKDMSRPKKIAALYIFPSGSTFQKLSPVEAKDNTVAFTLVDGSEMNVQYHHTNLPVLLGFALILLLLMIIVITTMKRIIQKLIRKNVHS